MLRALKTRMLMGMQIIKARLRRFQLGMKTLFGKKLKTMSVTLCSPPPNFFFPVVRSCPETLPKAGLKDGGFTDLVEEISRQPSVQVES